MSPCVEKPRDGAFQLQVHASDGHISALGLWFGAHTHDRSAVLTMVACQLEMFEQTTQMLSVGLSLLTLCHLSYPVSSPSIVCVMWPFSVTLAVPAGREGRAPQV